MLPLSAAAELRDDSLEGAALEWGSDLANLNAITSWDISDVQHLARRAGFGISPEEAAALAVQPPGAVVEAWVDGTAVDRALFEDVLSDRADPVDEPVRDKGRGGTTVAAVPGPHRYLVAAGDAWRNDLTRAQASWAFRMQFNPYSFEERMALFWHNFFATGQSKVNNVALMLNQIAMLRSQGLGRFDDLLVAVSKDPAMAIWLDLVVNRGDDGNVPNENYAREVLELYSLGADNGYDQQDIVELSRALTGWSFTVPPELVIANPTRPSAKSVAGGTFRVYDGSPTNGQYIWNSLTVREAPESLPNYRASGAVSFLGQSFDLAAAADGMPPGEDALRSIVVLRSSQCARFLAGRLLEHFVTARYDDQDHADLQAAIQSAAFDLRTVMKQLLKSEYFYDASNRYALVEGPVSWIVRAARALGPSLAAADDQSPKGFPAWAVVTPAFEHAGMKLLDPAGPNGWREDLGWLSSGTIRYRAKLAAALALEETFSQAGESIAIFPSSVSAWFPVEPTRPQQVFDRLVALLQPAAIPVTSRNAWLDALWPAAFSWDETSRNKARELAFLILSSPAGQLC